jgi:protoporphyrinogen/coproporphyrinogen III oxidase
VTAATVHVVVVGGGISGLAAAYRLRRLLGAGARLTVVEQARTLGGKLHAVPLAGVPYDVGAEAFLVRRPEAVNLIRELGLGDELVHPSAHAVALVRFDGRLAALPPRTVLGVPATVDGLDGVLSADGLARVRAEPTMPMRWDGTDVAVGPLVARRLGTEVAMRLVDPLLGGVYAGRADTLGLRPTMPALAAALDDAVVAGQPPSLLAAAAAALAPAHQPVRPGGPVLGALRGGMPVLVEALVRASGARLRLGLPVRALARTAGGWRLEMGAAPTPEYLDADGVLLAVPPPALRKLLAPLHPVAAAAAAGIDVASSVIVSLALPADAELPASSGVLVAAGEPLYTKAFTFSTVKWPHLDGGLTVLRASLGRHGEARSLRADDAELIRFVRADLAELTGVTVPPVDAAVTRWGGGLPQYYVGHLDRVAAIEAGVAALPRLAVAGAALHGIGIPACIATADAAAGRLAAQLHAVAVPGPHAPAGPHDVEFPQ